MGKKKKKVKDKCCEKYLKSGKRCKDCPFRAAEAGSRGEKVQESGKKPEYTKKDKKDKQKDRKKK